MKARVVTKGNESERLEGEKEGERVREKERERVRESVWIETERMMNRARERRERSKRHTRGSWILDRRSDERSKRGKSCQWNAEDQARTRWSARRSHCRSIGIDSQSIVNRLRWVRKPERKSLRSDTGARPFPVRGARSIQRSVTILARFSSIEKSSGDQWLSSVIRAIGIFRMNTSCEFNTLTEFWIGRPIGYRWNQGDSFTFQFVSIRETVWLKTTILDPSEQDRYEWAEGKHDRGKRFRDGCRLCP